MIRRIFIACAVVALLCAAPVMAQTDGETAKFVEGRIIAFPVQGQVPLSCAVMATVINKVPYDRTVAARYSFILPNGMGFTNLLSGEIKLEAYEIWRNGWNQHVPAHRSYLGTNTLVLNIVDVTPAPFNQPPFPPSGDYDTNHVKITALP